MRMAFVQASQSQIGGHRPCVHELGGLERPIDLCVLGARDFSGRPILVHQIDVRIRPELACNPLENRACFVERARHHQVSDQHARISYLRAQRMMLYRIGDDGAASAADAAAPLLQPGAILARAQADELLYNEARNEVVVVKYLDSPPLT